MHHAKKDSENAEGGRHAWSTKRKKGGPAEVAVREATRADDIFTKLRSEMLKAIFTTIKSKGRKGAPPQSIKA
jgi:hypothetical protein